MKTVPAMFHVEFSFLTKEFTVDFETAQKLVITEESEHYTGEYEVTPTPDSQVLHTKQKIMDNDLTIKAIPYFDVSNLSGGSTVYIGSELDNGDQ